MASRRNGIPECGVNLRPEDFALVEQLSTSLNLSRAEVIRRLVAQFHAMLRAGMALEDRVQAGDVSLYSRRQRLPQWQSADAS